MLHFIFRTLKFLMLPSLFALPGVSLCAEIKDYGLTDYVSISKDLPHTQGTHWKLVCTMPYNCHFQPWIEVEANAVSTNRTQVASADSRTVLQKLSDLVPSPNVLP